MLFSTGGVGPAAGCVSSKSQFRDVHDTEHGILLSSCSQRGLVPHGILIRLRSLAWKGQRVYEAEQEHPPLKIYKQLTFAGHSQLTKLDFWWNSFGLFFTSALRQIDVCSDFPRKDTCQSLKKVRQT